MERPWIRARKQRSQLQEEGIGRLEGGSKQINSGRTSWRSKRDNRLWDFLIEARTTETNSYRIERDDFKKLERESAQTPPGCLPGMQITIRDLELIAFRLNDFQDFMIELEGLRERIRKAEAQATRDNAAE